MNNVNVRTSFIVCCFFRAFISLEYKETKTCAPYQKSSWKNRENRRACDHESGQYYHCMKGVDRGLIEFCMTIYSFHTKDGCPVIDTSTEGLFTYTECTNEKVGCPKRRDGYYYSNQLYKYPGCLFFPEEEVTTDTRFLTSLSGYSTWNITQKFSISSSDLFFRTSKETKHTRTTLPVTPFPHQIPITKHTTIIQNIVFVEKHILFGTAGVVTLVFIICISTLCIMVRRNKNLTRMTYVTSPAITTNGNEEYTEINEVNVSEVPYSGDGYLKPIDARKSRGEADGAEYNDAFSARQQKDALSDHLA